MQTKNTHSFKRWSFRGWKSCFALFLGMPLLTLLLYFGYCWGLWGRHSLLLQYLFQCSCPPASEEARYPDEVDVIVSACYYGSSTLSPSGRLLAVYEKEPANASRYVLDIQTGEKISISLPEKGGIYFLTDNWLYFSVSYDEKYILDRMTGNRYLIKRFFLLRPDAYEGNDANPTLLAEILRQAKYVFFRDQDDSLIALDPNFPISTENSFFIEQFDIPGEGLNRMEQFLKENNIVYQTIPVAYPDYVMAPDERFIAHPDGIYLTKTGQKIVEGYSASNSFRGYSGEYFEVRGWTADGTAVIYSKLLDPCLIETTFFIFDDYTCYFDVPQPAILLKIPEEQLPP